MPKVTKSTNQKIYYTVFVKHNVVKLVSSRAPFSQYEKLVKEGWQEVWDSAPSKKAAYWYAWKEYGALPDYKEGITCVNCGLAPARLMFKGKRWHDDFQRYFPFKGRICLGCHGEKEMFIGEILHSFDPFE